MLFLKGGNFITMSRESKNVNTLIIKDGKIVNLGLDLTVPEGAEVINCEGKYVLPGFIDAHSHVGIYEEGIQFEGDDVNEATDPITPHLRALDAVNPEDLAFQDARENGVTTVITGPGSANVIGGEGLAVKTYGTIIDEMVIKAPTGLKAAFGENPKRVYSAAKKTPSTRMGTAALLRETLVKAQNYMKKLEKGMEDPEKMPERDLKMETLVKVLRKELPLRCHAHRADDIVTAIRVAEEFDINLSIEHCTEGHKIAEFLAKKNVPCIIGPSMTNRAKYELKDRTLKTAGILAKAGVKVAIMTDHPVIPIHFLPLCAALAVKEGMDEEEALKAITINAAEISGIEDRVGSLDIGKDADIAVFDHHPLNLNARAEIVIINGEIIKR